MDTLAQDLRYALRQMRSAPWFTLVIVTVLALGMGASSAAVSYLRGIASIPAPGVAPDDRLVQVAVIGNQRGRPPAQERISYANFVRLRENLRASRGLAGERIGRMAVDFGSGARASAVNAITADYFDVLRLRPALGNFIRAVDDVNAVAEPHAVISARAWATHFGGAASVLGRTIRINDVPFTVVGVAPEEFGGLHRDFHASAAGVWVNIGALHNLLPQPTTAYATAERDSLFISTMVARLAPDASLGSARNELAGAALPLLRSTDTSAARLSTWMGRLRIGDGPTGRDSDVTLAALSISVFAGVILLIACTNVSALLLGRAASRQHEIAVRFSLGADRRRVIRQLLTESILLAAIAGAAGVATIYAVRRAIFALTIDSGLLLFPLDWMTIAVALGTAALTGVVFGMSPALHATHASIFTSIKHGEPAGDWRRTRAQRGMIVAQLALSQPLVLVTVIALGLIAAQQPWKSTFHQGDHVVGVGLDFESRRYPRTESAALISALRLRLSEMPEVEATEVADRVDGIFEGASQGTQMIRLAPERLAPGAPKWETNWRGGWAEEMHVGPAFFEVTGIPIVRGRGFVASDTLSVRGTMKSIILPEDVAKLYWPNEDPVGKRLGTADEPGRDGGTIVRAGAPTTYQYVVVGVARSPRTVLPDERPRVYWPGTGRSMSGNATVIVRTRVPGETVLNRIRAEVHRLAPQVPIAELTTAAQAVRANASTAGRLGAAASALAMFALGLASLGLAGIVMFAVSQRTREIGVRIALGAQRAQIVGLFVRQGFRTALLGFAIGLPVSALLFFATVKFFFAPQLAVNYASALVAAAILLSVVLVASWLPARRAAKVDPVVALRAE